MAGESYAIPPKDRAVEGILWSKLVMPKKMYSLNFETFLR